MIRSKLQRMIICVCHRVSERDIAREAAAGCPDFDALQDNLRVATGCGACLDYAQMAFEEHAGARAASSGGCPGAARCHGVAVAA